ncbi:MAG: SPOR domain-containing protein [Gammaproteobacteria bacterium]
MAKSEKASNNKSSYKRPAPPAQPSTRAWIIAIILVAIFAGGAGYFDNHKTGSPTAFIEHVFQTKHTAKATTTAPKFNFYTDLPSSKLEALPTDSTTTTNKSKTQPASSATLAQTTSPATSDASSTTEYYLQIASFNDYSDADKLKAQLLLDDFNVNTEKTTINGKEWFRVIVGPYQDLTSLNAAQSQLNTLHFQSIPLRTK